MSPISIDTTQYMFMGDQYANEYIVTENSYNFIDSSIYMENHLNFREIAVIDEGPVVIEHNKVFSLW
jgi:hypothetical protein